MITKSPLSGSTVLSSFQNTLLHEINVGTILKPWRFAQSLINADEFFSQIKSLCHKTIT